MGLMLAAAAVALLSVRESICRCIPGVANFVNLPGLRLAFFEAHISAWVSRAAESNLIPCVGVRIVDRAAIGDEESPETLDIELRPEIMRSERFRIMNTLQDLLLRECSEEMKGATVKPLGHLFEGSGGDAIGVLIRRHIGVAIALDAVLEKALVYPRQHVDPITRYAIILRNDPVDDGEHGLRFSMVEESNRCGFTDTFAD
jgi:hypothetical protein